MATVKQKIAVSKVVSGSGIGEAMVAAGYSPKTDTTNLTKSEGWQELMEKYLSDEKIIKKVDEGLEATRVFSSHTEPDKLVPDYGVRHKYVETSLRIKGKLEPEAVEAPSVNFNFYGNVRLNGHNKPATEAEGSA